MYKGSSKHQYYNWIKAFNKSINHVCRCGNSVDGKQRTGHKWQSILHHAGSDSMVGRETQHIRPRLVGDERGEADRNGGNRRKWSATGWCEDCKSLPNSYVIKNKMCEWESDFCLCKVFKKQSVKESPTCVFVKCLKKKSEWESDLCLCKVFQKTKCEWESDLCLCKAFSSDVSHSKKASPSKYIIFSDHQVLLFWFNRNDYSCYRWCYLLTSQFVWETCSHGLEITIESGW